MADPTDMEELVDGMFEALIELDEMPTAFFGHCFGAMMMFELAHKLRREGRALPTHFFVSGARSPHSYTLEQLAADVEQYSPQPPSSATTAPRCPARAPVPARPTA